MMTTMSRSLSGYVSLVKIIAAIHCVPKEIVEIYLTDFLNKVSWCDESTLENLVNVAKTGNDFLKFVENTPKGVKL